MAVWVAQAKKCTFASIIYVRKKKNKSGTTSVVVVSKSRGRYKENNTFGASSFQEEVSSLCDQAVNWIKTYGDQQSLDFDDKKGRELEETERFINNTLNLQLI